MLTKDNILTIHNDALQNYSGTQGYDDDKLETIVSTAFKIQQNKNIYELCAYLLQSFILIKPFNSFNKKVALQCVGGLLSHNKIDFTLSSLEANSLLSSIEYNELTTPQIIAIIIENSVSHAP